MRAGNSWNVDRREVRSDGGREEKDVFELEKVPPFCHSKAQSVEESGNNLIKIKEWTEK